MKDFARQARRLLGDGLSLAEVLSDLRDAGAGAADMALALKACTPLRSSEVKRVVADFCHRGDTPLEQLTEGRLSLLDLARGDTLLEDAFRQAVLGGHRWLTLVPAPSGFDLWWKTTRGRAPEGSWSGQDLPTLAGLTQSFRAQLAAQPRLARHVEVSEARADLVQLHFLLDGDA